MSPTPEARAARAARAATADHRRRDRLLLLIMAILISAGLVGGGLALYDRFRQTNERRYIQQAFNQRIRDVSIDYCREIELLKETHLHTREEAYKNRKRDARLLDIELTPELEAQLAENLRQARQDFKPKPCPRPARLDSTPKEQK
jgi:hypothetical protein